MNKMILMFVALFFASCLWCSSALAIGLGAYVEGAGGSGKLEMSDGPGSWNIDTGGGAFGFVLDTSPADQSFFNYRLNAGFASQNWEFANGYKIESGGIYLENIFGFALIKSEKLSWWAGPLIRLGYYSGEGATSSIVKDKVEYAEFGLGLVTGVNFTIKNRVTLAPSIGVRHASFYGSREYSLEWGGITVSYQEDIEGYTTTGFLNFAVLF